MEIIQILALTLFGYLLGAAPFSLWIGLYWLGKDIRNYGDGNPGATNVLRAGSVPAYIVALLLDIGKGALPLGLAVHIFGITGWPVALIAIAPPIGHAFSPFLGFTGGKSVATAFGVWIGITIWQMPLVALTSLTVFALLVTPSGWAVLFTLIVMLGALFTWFSDPALLLVWLGQVPLLLWNHRAALTQRPRLRFLQRKAGKHPANTDTA